MSKMFRTIAAVGFASLLSIPSGHAAGINWLTVTNATALAGFQNVITNAAASNTAPAGTVFYRLKQ